MKITEKFIMSKTGKAETCEDIIYVSDRFMAVIDGATARDASRYDGKSSGRVAAEMVSDTLNHLSRDATLSYTLKAITEAFRGFYGRHGIDISDHSKRLTASAAIFSKESMEIWMVGDCQAMVNGRLYQNPNGIDEHVAAIRAMINQAEIKKGKSIEWIAKNDPGAVFIRPLLTTQFFYQNNSSPSDGTFSYAALDGIEIEFSNVNTIPVSSCSEIVLASDGYPVLFSTLLESEKKLAELLRNDPLCIYENKCVKGLVPGNVSFDDRSYLRISV